MDELTETERRQIARLGRYYRTAPLESSGDNPQAIRSLLQKGYLDCLQFGERPAMYRIKAGKLADLPGQNDGGDHETQVRLLL